ncbi:neurofibromin 1, partial [Trichoderma arundinaceum]
MSGDTSLVACLVERLSSRLPHLTGTSSQNPLEDEVLHITRSTLVDLSKTSIDTILESFVGLLEDLARPYGTISDHPSHVLSSELFVLSLAADCCSANWTAQPNSRDGSVTLPSTALGERLVGRIFDVLKDLLEPISDNYMLSAEALLDQNTEHNPSVTLPSGGTPQDAHHDAPDVENQLASYFDQIETPVKILVGYVTASSWSHSFNYLRDVIYNVRVAATADATTETWGSQESGRGSLIILRLVSSFWVDSSKLGLIIQEICSSYLHFRKSYQATVAATMPLLIARWIDRYPQEFVHLHRLHKRLDGGPDTLFDMTQTVTDNGRRKTLLFPLQTTLLFLMPDVFEVASNLREAKSNNVMKKVSFLDGLRKAMKNGNEQAGYCVISLLRAARHFSTESDSALVSYAMDVQDEVRDAVFRHSATNSTSAQFGQNMITAAFITLAHLNLDVCVDTVLDTCISPSSPHSFKVAVIQACCHLANQPDSSKYNELFNDALPFIQSQLKACVSASWDSAASLSSDVINMARSILKFLGALPTSLLNELTRQTPTIDTLGPFIFTVISSNKAICHTATEVAERLFAEHPEAVKSFNEQSHPEILELRETFWTRSSKVLLELCEQMLQPRLSELTIMHDYLKARLTLLRNIPELTRLSDELPDMVAASSKLETVLLVSLCSADIDVCQLVTSCIGLFLAECSCIGEFTESVKSSASILRNGDIFREIASPAFRFTGLVAFQKRIRNLLRRIQFPTLGILNAWEMAFDRWIYLVQKVSTLHPNSVDDRLLSEWRNFSGFLASLGGACTADQAIVIEEPSLHNLRWIDRSSPEQSEEPSLKRYLKLAIQLLACANVRVREAMREILSSEVSSVLYPALFKSLESELEVLFAGVLAPADKAQETDIIFAEQAASLLKTLVERLEIPADLGAASSVHLGLMTLNFAKFIDGIADTANTLRVKIRVCQLCEAVTKRKEHLNLRDDVHIRNQLLEYTIGWIDRPRSPHVDQAGVGGRQDDLHRVQKDLDKACLRSLADLTFRLPLQPADSQSDVGMSEMKSQMFHTYFNRFLSLLNHESAEVNRSELSTTPNARDEVISNSDLAITILSNLLSANIDVGLKHSINIGYHDNVEIRTAFVKVLFNILVQGTEFSNLTDSAVSKKYEELLELLTTDISLPASMSAICPSTEVDELTICLLTVFEQRGLIFELFEALIRAEIEQTGEPYCVPILENETEILRRNCVATKMLSVYARWKGFAYLQGTLHKVLERLMLTSQDLDLELDPTRVGTQEELQKNALQLQIVAKVFMDDICASASNIPPSFRKICSIISDAVLHRFPNAKYTAVGAFIFLRFFCPAIVAPEVEGLVPTPPSKEMRRGLLLIAKIIQNLANNVLFGTKEPYMFPLNLFLVQNIHVVMAFLREISIPPSQMEISINKKAIDFGSCVALHRFLYDHWDHLQQILVSKNKREYVRSPGEHSRGRSPAMEPLRNLIANLGPPPLAISWNRPQISTNSPPLYSRFQNFMLRNAFRGTESYLTSRAVYDGGESKEVLSGLRLSTTVNDIFRLGDVEEATTTLQSDDDSSFGLRADGGKIVMYFTSPKKADILQTIRSAKNKHGKENHISIPIDPTRFVVEISNILAATQPQLTSDFLTEFFVGWESFPEEQKPLSLAYMSPWLAGLRTNVLTSEQDSEKGREKVATLLRKLIDLIVLDQHLSYSLQHFVLPSITNDELLLDIFLDELIKTALSYGAHEESLDVISPVVIGIGTVSIRGKIFSRLRKTLNRSSLRPTRYLQDSPVWAEICVLLQFCVALSFDSGVQSRLYLPEIFHIVTMLANTGDNSVRSLVYKLLINSIHSVCTAFNLDEAKFTKLKANLDLLCEPRGEAFSLTTSTVRDGASVSTAHDSSSTLAATENLTVILFDICSTAAPSVDLANSWRSRWMSLVASTAFQNNPAVQPRAFAVMGYLAREEVDDDLLYQVLVALRNSIGQFGEDGNSEMLISIVTSLSKMMIKLPSTSRYGLQLFWLAMSLVRLVPVGLFNCTAQFLEAVLTNIGAVGSATGEKIVPLLLQSRGQLEEAALPLDDAYGIHFDYETFHFAVCACLVRGLTDTSTRPTAIRVLSSFSEIANGTPIPPTTKDDPMGDALPYLALISARGVLHEDYRDGLWIAGVSPEDASNTITFNGRQRMDNVRDKDLLLISAIELVDFQFLEERVQVQSLQWLNDLALQRPLVFEQLCGAIPSLIEEVLLHSQDSSALKAANTLLRTISSDANFRDKMTSMRPLIDALHDVGFTGLWRFASQDLGEEIRRECFDLTERLIE